MKVRDLLNVMNGDSKIKFYTNANDVYKGTGKKRTDSVSVQRFFGIEDLYKDQNLLEHKVLMVTAMDKNVLKVKIKKGVENEEN